MATFIFTCYFYFYLLISILSGFSFTQFFLCRRTPQLNPQNLLNHLKGQKASGYASCDLTALLFRNTNKSLNCCCFSLKALNFHLVLQGTFLFFVPGFLQAGSLTQAPLAPPVLPLSPCCNVVVTLLPCRWEGPILTIFSTKTPHFRTCRRSATS